MSYTFTEADIEKISEIIGSPADRYENSWSWKAKNEETNQSLVFSVHNDVTLGGARGSLVSAQTRTGYFELHGPTGFIEFEPDEIIFVCAEKERVSSLIIGRQATCSLYANIGRKLLTADFKNLDSPALLAAMQLSLAEGLLP